MKTVIVTGASRGIGACVAKEFAKKGYNVVVNYFQSEKKANEVASEVEKLGGHALLIKADVSDPAQVRFMIEKTLNVFGKIDVLVNNAGISISGLLIDMTDEQIQKLVYSNLVSVLTCSREVAKHMIYEQNGRIVNISSIWGIVGGSNETVYSATKAGVIGFSKALAKELGFSNITVNVVAPGFVETDMTKDLSSETKNEISTETTLQRLGTPNDIASAVMFLASDEASFITGQVLRVDGGWNL